METGFVKIIPQAPTPVKRPTFTPPKDPFLRAVWRVSHYEDLTPTERLALLALWRFLAGERKRIGPGLLAKLIATSRGNAKQVLWQLRVKGYIGSSGREGCGVQTTAVRWVTPKAKLSSTGKRLVDANRSKGGRRLVGANRSDDAERLVGTDLKRLVGADADQGVGHTDPLVGATHLGVGKNNKNVGAADDEPTYSIAEIMAGGGGDA